jgi:hydrogenase/urease accessory protein HupE
MRPLPLFRRLLVSFSTLVPAVAFAHPGHDGGHDGGLTWDFVGEVMHRLGSPYHLAPTVVVGLLAFGIWKLTRHKRDAAEKK